jgi:hypothetical protein
MQPYLVHLEREELTDWTILTLDERGRSQARRYYNSYVAEVDSNLDQGKPHEMETWYCQDEEGAIALCKTLAQKCPGRNVNMYKLAGVAMSTAAPASFGKYSEKGLVP